jgi:exosortase
MEAPAAPAQRLAPREWVLLALLAAAFSPALLSLAGVWSTVDYQSHGFLVPVVSLWVALRERYAWRRLAIRPDGRGLALLAAAVFAYLAGIGMGSVPLQGVALVAALAGAVLYTRGPAWLRHLGFPIAFLLFMVPVPSTWIAPFIVRLQFFVSDASVRILHALGVAIAREGNVLVLPDGASLFVAEACSGVTSVITLAPLAVLLAYLTLRRPAARIALVFAVVPLAMAGNLARVLATVGAAERFGTDVATTGPPHELLGLLTYAVAVGLLLALGAVLRSSDAPERPAGA